MWIREDCGRDRDRRRKKLEKDQRKKNEKLRNQEKRDHRRKAA